MIPPTQREALAVLAEVVDLSPDIRLGRLFAQLGFLGEDQTGRPLGSLDDEQLLAVLHHHRAELAAKRSNAPNLAGAAMPFPCDPAPLQGVPGQ